MKGWWREWLYEPYIIRHAGVPAWLDSLPKPARDELMRLLLRERGSVDGIANTMNRFGDRHRFPELAGLPGLTASNVLYLKEGMG